MGDATCSEPGCDRRAAARGLCKQDYATKYRSGTLPPHHRTLKKHTLTSVDLENRVADCATCGPRVRIRICKRKTKGGIRERIWCKQKKAGSIARIAQVAGADDPKDYYWRYQYRISRTEYDAMSRTQGDRCAICREAPIDGPLVVDHDHACCPPKTRTCGDCVRGLLCRLCNLGLGYFRDRPDFVEQALRYLTQVA